MKKILAITGVVTLLIAIFYIVLPIGRKFNEFRIEDSIHRDYFPVVRAILDYTDDRGAAPEKLDDLVPQFLAHLPSSQYVKQVDYISEGTNWTLSLHSDATVEDRIYHARHPNFTQEEIDSSLLFYHVTWLVKEG